MLLHNQRGCAVSWEANGKVYEWEPYGACELPDALVPLIKSEGFPVDFAPVPPREKAERTAALITESEMAQELEKVRKDLVSAEARAAASNAAAEAADLRATAVRKEAEEALELARVRGEELRSLRSDATEYERMLAESAAELSKLREQLKIEQSRSAEPAQTPKNKSK